MDCVEETTVEVGNIIKEMGYHVPECFLGHYIFLATNLAIPASYKGTTVKAILFFSLGNVRQPKFLLKNKYKNIQETFLFRY